MDILDQLLLDNKLAWMLSLEVELVEGIGDLGCPGNRALLLLVVVESHIPALYFL